MVGWAWVPTRNRGRMDATFFSMDSWLEGRGSCSVATSVASNNTPTTYIAQPLTHTLMLNMYMYTSQQIDMYMYNLHAHCTCSWIIHCPLIGVVHLIQMCSLVTHTKKNASQSFCKCTDYARNGIALRTHVVTFQLAINFKKLPVSFSGPVQLTEEVDPNLQ